MPTDENPMLLSSLPASDGDCFVLSYDDPRRHIVVDGGRRSTYAALRGFLQTASERAEILELLVVTHFDADHIEGVLELVRDATLPLTPGSIWFNGFEQVVRVQDMNMAQADELTQALKCRGWAVNGEFDGRAVGRREDGQPTTVTLPGGMRMTILSPDAGSLARLRAMWMDHRETPAPVEELPLPIPEVQNMGRGRTFQPKPVDFARLLAEPERIDVNTANAASIALMAEWEGKRVCFMADAHPRVLVRGLRDAGLGWPVKCDVATAVHHGSAKNSNAELASALDCLRFVVSTDGSHHSHPDQEAIARLLVQDGQDRTLCFNYRQPWTEVWDQPALKRSLRYETRFPSDEDGVLRVWP